MAVLQEIHVPDIGGASAVDVIEILVNVGDVIQKDTSLMTLESDKASMEIPSPAAGVVQSIDLKVGDKVGQGDLILTLAVETTDSPAVAATIAETPVATTTVADSVASPTVVLEAVKPEPSELPPHVPTLVAAGPSVRRFARTLGVDITTVPGSGRNARITREDVKNFVKQQLSEPRRGDGLSVPHMPAVDFGQFGEIEIKPLNKIKRLTGINVHRAWVTIPHVTQFDSADVTELEAFRISENEHLAADGVKLTSLAFICKVVAKALLVFPQFNASLDASGEQLIYKRYYNIGIAVETPNGLVVPVIKQVDDLTVTEIAREMGRLSKKARDKGLMPTDMRGGCFTISSLGGIGGTGFTPIVNSPEVAILGVSRASHQPVYQSGIFVPRLMLPLSLSYDHRVIDGAEAARFTRFISDSLSDIRRILL